MKNIQEKIALIDWESIKIRMHEKGFAVAAQLLSDEDCRLLIDNYDDSNYYRKTITMERYRFGLGEYKYFTYQLPDLLQTIRKEIYSRLAPIANEWMAFLNTGKQFPATFEGLQKLCHDNHQTKPTVLILRYGKGGHNTLHQDLYGDVFFPIQAVLFLNEPDKDYTGGEFVLTQQTPRHNRKRLY